MTSIVLPTFDSVLFLKERVDSILSQTYSDWECIVIDGYSSDGTWEYLQKIAQSDHRFSLFQYPPKGPYDAWNKGIEKAKGEYIYIATADDTMTVDCLDKMVKALEKNPDCGIAHCNLQIIDKEDKDHPSLKWNKFLTSRYFEGMINIPHKRLAPHDGLLHCMGETVYTSITQLLIRRSLFETIGLFREDLGPIADFEWGMKASLLSNTVHIPEYLATWRIHDGQVTNTIALETYEYKKNIIKAIKSAYREAQVKREELKKFNLAQLTLIPRLAQIAYLKKRGKTVLWSFYYLKLLALYKMPVWRYRRKYTTPLIQIHHNMKVFGVSKEDYVKII